MMARSFASIALVALFSVGCGPSVGQGRLVYAPPRPADCELRFLKLDVKDVSPEGRWELLGHVVLSQHGVRDPLDPSYRAEVRPRACAMGGEGVGVMMTGTAEPWALSAGGTTIDYAVVRKRKARGAAKPQRF